MVLFLKGKSDVISVKGPHCSDLWQLVIQLGVVLLGNLDFKVGDHYKHYLELATGTLKETPTFLCISLVFDLL